MFVYMSRTTQFFARMAACPGEVSDWQPRKRKVAKEVSSRGRDRLSLPFPELPACPGIGSLAAGAI